MIPTLSRFTRLPHATALLLVLAPAGLRAQPVTDGQMGGTSRASVRISVIVAPRFLAQSAAVLEAERKTGWPDAPTDRFCISSNMGSGTFSVTASAPLALRPGAGKSTASSRSYVMEWREPGGHLAVVPLLTGSTVSGLPAGTPECLSRAGTSLRSRRARDSTDSVSNPAIEPLVLLVAAD